MLEHYIKSGKLSEFIDFLFSEKMKERNEKIEQKTWELWLHKVFDKSYKEFSETVEADNESRKKAGSMKKIDVQHAAKVALNTIKLLNTGGDAGESI